MIAIIDVWTLRRPPEGGADDDDLLRLARTTARAPAITLGDSGAPQRARAFGIDVMAHRAALPQAPWLAHRGIARVLKHLGRPDVEPASEFARRCAAGSGAILARAHVSSTYGTAELPDAKPRIHASCLVPLATHTSRIDAVMLIQACALLAAGERPHTIVLPTAAHRFQRARWLAANADRTVDVHPTRSHPATLLGIGQQAISLDLPPNSPQLALAAERGVRVIDARGAASPLSLAAVISEQRDRDSATD
ncbi:MAG: hypothetical protein AAGH71_03410 [Planctomycetota bacterium]